MHHVNRRGGGQNQRGRGRGRGKGTTFQENNCHQVFINKLSQILQEATPDARFCDTHVHLEYIIQKKQNKNQVIDSKEVIDLLQNQFVPPSCPLYVRDQFFQMFDSCIAIFCDTAALSPSLGLWQDLLDDTHHDQFKIYGAFGIHPHNAKYYNEFCERSIAECLKHPNAIAYGEIGLDYHYDNSPREIQKQVFAQQLIRAVELKKPVVIHTREAEEDTLEIMKTYLPEDWKVHIHCFTDSADFAKKLIQNFKNVYFGFTGVITYESTKNTIQQTLKDIVPIERILLETDGPYMPPNNGMDRKKNDISHCGHIPLIASKIAELKGINVDRIFKQCRENTTNMYGI